MRNPDELVEFVSRLGTAGEQVLRTQAEILIPFALGLVGLFGVILVISLGFAVWFYKKIPKWDDSTELAIASSLMCALGSGLCLGKALYDYHTLVSNPMYYFLSKLL